MSTKNIRTGNCAVCGRRITLRADGTLRNHGPQVSPCLGVNHTPDAAARLILPPLSPAQLDMIRDCWRVGDWRPIELEFGITCQHFELSASTYEEALAEMVNDTRRWIERLIELSRAHSPQNLPAPNDTNTR